MGALELSSLAFRAHPKVLRCNSREFSPASVHTERLRMALGRAGVALPGFFLAGTGESALGRRAKAWHSYQSSARETGVMSEVRHSYVKCTNCGRPTRRFASELARRAGGWYCTRACFQQAQAAFRICLETGLLDQLLALPEVQDKFQGARRFAKLQQIAETSRRPHAPIVAKVE